MKEFKVGDKVYCPYYGTDVFEVQPNTYDEDLDKYPLRVCAETFTVHGKSSDRNYLQGIFHATSENQELLEKLYGLEFEKPPVKPTSREIIQAMLKRGDKCVPCWVSDDYEPPLPFNVCVLITQLVNDEFRTHAGVLWEYATPFDPKTGEPITELPT